MVDIVWLKDSNYVLIRAENKEELHLKINKAKGKKIVVLGSNNEVNRAALESKNVDVLLSPELTRKKDYMKYRDSGLNQVLCKIAHNNGKAIGINYDEIKKIKDKKEKAQRIGRIIQNIRLCRKYKVKIILVSFSKKTSDFDLKVFARVLGIA